MRHRSAGRALLTIALVLLASATSAVTVPHPTFTPTFAIKADEVNKNFGALANAITVLEAPKLRLRYHADGTSPKASGMTPAGLVLGVKDFESGLQPPGSVQVSSATGWELKAPRPGFFAFVVNVLASNTCGSSSVVRVGLEKNSARLAENAAIGSGGVGLTTTLQLAAGDSVRPVIENNCADGANYGEFSAGTFITVTEL